MLDGPEIWIVLGIIVLLFGSSKIPQMARSLGEARREFKKSLAEGTETGNVPGSAGSTTASGVDAVQSPVDSADAPWPSPSGPASDPPTPARF